MFRTAYLITHSHLFSSAKASLSINTVVMYIKIQYYKGEVVNNSIL